MFWRCCYAASYLHNDEKLRCGNCENSSFAFLALFTYIYFVRSLRGLYHVVRHALAFDYIHCTYGTTWHRALRGM